MAKEKKEKKEKLGIFDFLKSITTSKNDLSKHELFHRDYNPYRINRWLSMCDDLYCISFAMFLSEKNKLSKEAHYKFLLYELPKGYRNFKYQNAKNEHDKGVVNLVKMYYNVSEKKCNELLRLLTDEQLTEIEKSHGGKV